MTDRELLELIAAQVTKLTTDVQELKGGQAKLESGQAKLESGQARLEQIVTRIEVEHGKKLSALFDGYKQNTDKLERIESEVIKHDEFILKKIR